ncbi:hypothetical protein AVEN_43208-1 [Araneus ventricosus]|uniref:Uncharacterized protein n=1 Tax=Araneus ventricosus TaxID=182803 RepID=A0A4Y2K2I5_ARAVE|nr:hypothetical protein AVEN_43208-1 [Araneus ventricosus]
MVSSSRNQTTGTTPQWAIVSPNFHATPAAGHLASTDLVRTRPLTVVVVQYLDNWTDFSDRRGMDIFDKLKTPLCSSSTMDTITSHSWYRSEGPVATIHFKGDRKDQTALARLASGHLKTLRFSRGDKKFKICTKCNMIEATPQHLLDCVDWVRPDFVLEVMKANDLMDLI